MSQPDPLHEASDARGDAAPPYLHSVFAFAAKAGALLLASGAGAADVVDAMLAIARTAALDDVTVDVTYTDLTISYHPDQDVPYTRVRTIPQRTFNYGKLTKVTQLVERYCQGQLTLNAARDELRRLETASGPYPVWLTRLAAGVAGASAALIFGGGWLAALAAFVANIALDYLYGVLARHAWPMFYMQAVTGGIAVLAAVVVHLIGPGIDSSRVVVSVIIVMLAGMTTTGAIQDALTGWYLTALGRLFEAAMNTIGLIVGIKVGLLVTGRLGVNLTVTPDVSMGAIQLPVMLLAAALVAVGFSFVAQNPPRIIVPTAILSAIGYAADSAASGAQLGVVWSSAVAAFVVGAITVVYTQWFKAPAAPFAICAILPLLPGLMLYQRLSDINGLDPLANALGTALALAGGLGFGQYFTAVVRRRLRLVENRFFAPLFVEPSASRHHQSGAGKRETSSSD